MKRTLLAVVVTVAMWTVTVRATDITIWDTLGTNPGSGLSGENQEVEPGCVWGQEWDMEAFLFDATTKKLQIRAGFDMVNGQWSGGWGRQFYSGDIFIDVNGDAKWGSAINFNNNSGNGYFNVANSYFNWDYAIVFGRTSYAADGGGGVLDGSYKVVNLMAGSPTDLEVFFDLNNKANPFRVAGNSGGSYANSYNLSSFSDSEGTHYLLGNIDLSFLAGQGVGANPLTFHFTEGCGNDLLMGQTTAFSTPDGGGTVAILGMSMSALALVSRRLRKNQ